MNERESRINSNDKTFLREEGWRGIERRRSRLARLGVISPVVALTIVAAFAASGRPAESPPALDLGLHDVPWVKVDIRDENGDDVFDMVDARRQKGGAWLAQYDLNAERNQEDRLFKVDGQDIELIEGRVCKLPVLPHYDPDEDGHITERDVKIVVGHQGVVKEDLDPNVRLTDLWGGIVTNKMVVTFERNTSDEEIEKFLKSRDYDVERYTSGRPKRAENEIGITILPIIPQDLLENSGLEDRINEAKTAKGVLQVDTYKLLPPDYIQGQDPSCE